MEIYYWGDATDSERVGLGGVREEQISVPTKIHWTPPDSYVIQISCGRFHTLFLTSSGKIFSCGNNDHGQLGHEHASKRPRLVTGLENYTITRISCGGAHSMALNEWGQIFAWGNNDSGQLGIPDCDYNLAQPKIVRNLISKHVVQIACGNSHSLALTNCGELYAWGSNIYGELGVSSESELASSDVPLLITALKGIPIGYITCGGNHSFAVSKSGAVFGWGHNNCGQLGLNDYVNRCYPAQLKTLRSLGVRYITCGFEFSVFLTNDGGVFTCGGGVYGQLGHGGIDNEDLPRMVVELMGSTVTQIACGTRHTLALVPSRGRIYGFGFACTGQLGECPMNISLTPQVVLGPWVSPNGQALIESVISEGSAPWCIIKQIFSGGDHNLVTCTYFVDKIPPADYRIYDVKTQVLCLTEELAEQISRVEQDSTIYADLLPLVELIFKSQACLNGSFLLPDFKHSCCSKKHHGIDLKSAEVAFGFLSKLENENLKSLIWEMITNELLNSLRPSPPDVEALRIYLLLPFYHEFVNSKNYEYLHTPFSTAVFNLNEIPRTIVKKWWSKMPSEWFEQLVSNYKSVVAYIITFKMQPPPNSTSDIRKMVYERNLAAALKMLEALHKVNNNEREEKIDYQIFHWSELQDFVDMRSTYVDWWCDPKLKAFNICNYPFLFDVATKTTLLQTDQQIQKWQAVSSTSTENFVNCLAFGRCANELLVLNVSRENLVQDTIREIWHQKETDLKKPLKVKFSGEEAVDAGGVRKEFFLLVLKDLLDPKYGMFKEYEDSHALWFADVTFETESMYFLIGVICGLAIYNFTIINLPFPLALYKKLLNEKVDLNDLKQLSPTISNSMQQILDYNDKDFEETFDLRFEISRDVFGELKTEPLKADGEKIAVTNANRHEFVDLYVEFIFNKAVDKQFKAFRKGFLKVCGGRVLTIFRPEELMAMVVGNEEYDWKALELNCGYKNGYKSSDETIKWFWEVFHNLPLSEKKKFLLFLTGSDRVPVQGMKAFKIYIQPVKDDKCLPVAHTCFNLLDLPMYNTKERLKYKLLQAIEQTQGFSLV